MPAAADKLLSQHWDGRLPVDVFHVARRQGIATRPSSTICDSGMIELEGTDGSHVAIITYRASDAPVRQRFTVAHEIGHHVLGHLGERQRCLRDPLTHFSSNATPLIEREANDFAVRLLVPRRTLEFAVHEKGMTDVVALARAFGVAPAAMQHRLELLGMA